VSTGMLLYNIVGSGLSGPVQLTLPNTSGYKPGSVLYLMTVNPVTGGHDVAGQMIVSADGKTMTSTGLIKLFGTGATSSASLPSAPLTGVPVGSGGSGGSGNNFVGCLYEEDQDPNPTPTSFCNGCQVTAGSSGSSGSSSSSGSSGSSGSSSGAGGGGGGGLGGGGIMLSAGVMDSNAGLVTGEYFLNHQVASYQSQGQSIGINLQYSSVQADPTPVVQYQFTTPLAGNSS
jgi:hypothetical protein